MDGMQETYPRVPRPNPKCPDPPRSAKTYPRVPRPTPECPGPLFTGHYTIVCLNADQNDAMIAKRGKG